jgi:hypothetical protein
LNAEGRGVVDGVDKMRRMSQWMFLARRGTVESVVGRIIQRITRDVTMGLRSEAWRVLTNVGIEVEGLRERRFMVQIGIFEVRVVR